VSFFKNIFNLICRTKRKFQVDITIIFLFLITLTVVIVSSYTYSKTAASIFKFSKTTMERISNRILEKLEHYTQSLQLITELSTTLIPSSEAISLDNATLLKYLFDVIEKGPDLSGIYIGTPEGILLGAFDTDALKMNHYSSDPQKALPSEVVAAIWYVNRAAQPPYEIWQYRDEDYKMVGKECLLNPTFDPRVRPWYQGAVKKKGLFWSELYKTIPTGQTTIAVSCPAYDDNGNFIAILGVDLLLEQLSDFLSKQLIGEHGRILILDSDGHVLLTDNKSFTAPSSMVSETTVQQAFQKFMREGKPYFLLDEKKAPFLVSCLKFSLTEGTDWIVLSIVPITDFFGDVLRAHKQAYSISLIILIVAALIAIFFSRRISVPIIKLAQEVDKIKHLDLESRTRIHSNIKEIYLMDSSIADMKTALRSFTKYVPKDIVKKLIQEGKELALGGEKKEVAIMFSDIAQFTTIAEKMPTEILLPLLEGYFDLLSKIILTNQGTIDKYIGDSIMALWGAPVTIPDQAALACHAALLCQKAVQGFNLIRMEKKEPEFPTRIGIHIGTVIAGNLGTNERMNYTVIGDAVNTAARLQDVNKVYHTKIIISDAVYQKTNHRFLTRPLDLVAVKGREGKIKLYELIGQLEADTPLAPTAEQTALCKAFEEAYGAYENNAFSKAKELFQAILKKYPDDFPTQLYLQRLKNEI
jgi:adenylate cyclase